MFFLDWNHSCFFFLFFFFFFFSFFFFLPLVFWCLHAYSKHPNIFKKILFQEKKLKRGGAEEEEEKKTRFFSLSLSAIAGIHIPGKSHTFVLNQKRLPTCTTSTAASGCVQSCNHLHFQLKKRRIQTQLNSKPGSLSKFFCFVLFCFVFVFVLFFSVSCFFLI